MNNDNDRGFWWGDSTHTNSQGAMALTTNGLLTVASGIRVGYGETDTTIPSAGLDVNGSIASGTINTTSHVTIGTISTTNTGSLFLAGSTVNKKAELKCTNGNLHIDPDTTASLYLNYYKGTGGIFFGNGAASYRAQINTSGHLNLASTGTSPTGYALSVGTVGVISTSRNIDNVGTIQTNGDVLINGTFAANPYANAGARLRFCGGTQPADYYIGTNLENVGGNYSKLDLRWHTGIRMGAQGVYGGIRFFNNEDLTTKLMSIGEGSGVTDVKVYNDLNVVSNIEINGQTVIDGSRNITSVSNILSGNLRRTNHNVGHLEGSYNNVGANSAKTNPIYTIGSAYNPSATSVGGMYGIGYAHPNLGSWGSNKSSGWGLYVAEAGSIHATISRGGMWSDGAIQSNTSFILGSAATTLSQSGVQLKIQTTSGYCEIGPANSSWMHFETDRASFYFNTKITVDTGIVQSYDQDLILRRAQNSAHQLTVGTTGITATGNLTLDSTLMLNSGGWYRQLRNPSTHDAVFGTWTASGTSNSWGNIKVGAVGYAYTDSSSAYKQYNIPTGAQTAYMSQLKWSNGGYVDVHGVQADGDLVFLCRVSSFQDIENQNHGDVANHDGQEIRCIGTRLGTAGFTAIRITKRSGRFHFTGIAFSNQNVENVDNGIYRAEQIRGGALTGIYSVTTTNNITAYSDKRLKENIKTLDSKKALQMRGVSFIKDGIEGSGVIAQEIEEIAPELVMTADDEMGTKSVAYGNLVGYLIETVKDQQKQIDELKQRLDNDSCN
jgi:hypothetical protein